MILRGGIRGNGSQLSEYLVTKGENEHVRILEVDGRISADEEYLHQTIAGMGLMAELTKSQKAFYHAQINPAYTEDKQMDKNNSWTLAADILAKELGYEGQRRVIVLHEKKGRIHAHVVFERYNYKTGKLIDNKQSRLKQDNARKIMEQVFVQEQTPHRNLNRTALKEEATKLWNNTSTGAEFIRAARKGGYMVAEGTANRPFMIVDSNGRSFDLVRQLQGVRTKEVRARLRDEKLIPEKRAIEMMREQADKSGKTEQQKQAHKPAAEKVAQAFAENRPDTVKQSEEQRQKQKNEAVFDKFKSASPDFSKKPEPTPSEEQQRKEAAAKAFAENKPSALTDKEAERQERLRKLIAEQERIRQKQQQQKPKQ